MQLTLIPIGWRVAAVAIVIACASLWLNLHQYGTRRTAVEKARADVLADTLKVTAGIARDAQQDQTKLIAIVQGIADQRVQRTVIYRNAAATPLPENCAPGQQRMDAVNQGIQNK